MTVQISHYLNRFRFHLCEEYKKYSAEKNVPEQRRINDLLVKLSVYQTQEGLKNAQFHLLKVSH